MRVAAVSRTAAALLQWLCCAVLFLSSHLACASDAAGVSWLQAQVQPNGSLAQEGSAIAWPLQSRSETATTLKASTGTVSTQLLDAIELASDDTVEVLARKALAKQLGGASGAHLDALVLHQNPDGGFGAIKGYASNAQDTAWALNALAALSTAYSGPVDQAIAWLLAAQQSSGEWRLAPDSDGLVPTALVIQALQPFRQTATVAAALGRGRAWLMAERNGLPDWGTSVRNAHALMAVLPGLTNAVTLQAAVDALRGAQRPDGSWDADPYITALALRASFLARQPATDPDLAGVKGSVVSDATSLPLAGVSVRLASSAQSTVTDAQGRFEFLQLRAGSYKLAIDVTGYLSLVADVSLLKGQLLDLGAIRLQAVTAGNANTVTVSGIARFTSDGVNYQNADNATISIGGLTTQSNANGEYVLDGVPPGAADLKATYSSYPPVEVSFSALGGQQVRFDPVFRRGTAQSTLKVIVTDQATGAPLAMASVSLNGLVRYTSARGEAVFDTGVVAGDNAITVSAGGFATRILTMNVQGNRAITLPVTLAPQNVPPGQTILQGVVSDAAMRLPLAGATVAVAGTSRTATTDAAGRYVISGAADIVGQRTVFISKAGYQRFEQSMTLVQNTAHQLDVPLSPSVDPQQPISIRAIATDINTRLPIAGATLKLSGSNPYVGKTNAQGVVEISGLNPGVTQFKFTAAGYDDVAASTVLALGTRYVYVAEMAPIVQGQERIYGVVLDAQTQRPLAGAKLTLTGTRLLEVTSGADGRYEFSNITPGRWNLSANAPGYQGSSSGFDIAASTAINLALNPYQGLDTNNPLRAVAVGHPNFPTTVVGPVGYLFVFGDPGTTGQVVSNDGAINYGFAIGADGVAELMIPNSQFLNEPGKVVDKAIQIYASKGVSAYFLNREEFTTDMSYLLDATALGQEHRIVDWNYAYSEIQFSITAVEDGTIATVTPASNLTTGQLVGVPFDVTLQKGQAVIYTASSGNEITGTHIQTNKPVAVFAGGQCANIPASAGYCDHLFTQLPPVKYWSSEYVVPKTANTGAVGNLVRIVANTAATEVRVNGVLEATLNAGEFHEVTDAESLHIKSSAPVLVGQFLKGSTITTGGKLGDPAFTYISGLDQNLSEYAFTAPTNLSPYDENYLNIAIPTAALNTLQLNGTAVNVSGFAPLGTSGYSVGNVAIPTGPGRIKAAEPFVVSIAGFSRDDSYLTIIGAKYSPGASPVDVIARVTASTDKPAYPADAAVLLGASVQNLGSTPARLTLVLRISDGAGAEVVRFAPQNLGEVAAGATVPYTQPWDTGRYPAGSYTLIATLLNAQGDTVSAGSTLFTITAGPGPGPGPGAGKAALTVAVDRAEYAPDDRVRISSLARNLTVNAPVDNARIRITVRSPNNSVVHTHVHQLGQLQANGLRTAGMQQTLKTAMEGTYTVEAVLIGSGSNLKQAAASSASRAKAYDVDVDLATATATYVVRASAPPGPPPPPAPPAPPLPPGSPQAIPVNQSWFLLLMCLLLGATAVQRLRPVARPPAQARRNRRAP